MPWKPQSLLALLAASMGCWLERQAAALIEYLKAEHRLIRARLGRRRILFADPERRSPGRPRTKIDIEQLVVRMVCENPSWGYTRIHGALLNLGIKVGRGTIRRIPKDYPIEPAPARDRRIA